MSSAKRGIDMKSSSSLAPWQRASIISTARPAACSGSMAELTPQPWITSTAADGRAARLAVGTHQANRVFPPVAGMRNGQAVRPKSPGVW